LFFIFVLSSAAGNAVTRLGLNLPPLLGMLCTGFVLRNCPYIGDRIGGKIEPQWSSAIRSLALTLILCRAGLSLDLVALIRLRFVVARLALMPGLSEACIIAGLAALLLDFPFEWAAMLGFVVAAISPAVVIPSLLSLQDRGYGVSTGIPPMVVAAAALDDVVAISGFGICSSFAVGGSDSQWLNYARAPLELTMGPAIGIAGGCILWFVVPPRVDDQTGRDWRIVLLLGMAVTISLALTKAKFSGASALAVLCLAAAAAKGWNPANAKAVAGALSNGWNNLAQPLLFGLVGAAVSIKELKARIVGYGLLMLACSLTVRFGVTFMAVGCRGLRWQERVFIALAWMPKATVQAAIGGIALDNAETDKEREMGRDVLAIAVLSILCTAPIGAAIIAVTGPRLLLKEESNADTTAKPQRWRAPLTHWVSQVLFRRSCQNKLGSLRETSSFTSTHEHLSE
jgi:NhaP-type Na+/H+ or K+/H+ antiporter